MSSATRPIIGYVVKMFPRLSETFIRNEIAELERQGLALRIFSLKRPPLYTLQQGAGGGRPSVVYLPERVWKEPFRVLLAQFSVLCRHPLGYVRTLAHVLRGRKLRSLPRGLRRFSQTCCLIHQLGGAKHLHAHFASDPTRLASWARMLCGISFSVSTHAKDLFQDKRIDSIGLHYKLKAARFIVANSQFSASSLLSSINGSPSNGANPPPKVVTVYNGVDLGEFSARREEPNQPMILSVGRLIEKKGFEILLDACAILQQGGKRFTCNIVGSGPLRRTLQQQIERLGLTPVVRLHAECSHGQLLPFYERAMVFVLPCVVSANGDRDILPNVLKEAMAVGVPVVTTCLGGIEELVTHGQTGLLVEPGDSTALAGAIEHLLADARLRRHLATNAREVVEERFDLRSSFGRLKDLLLEAVES
jgi:glycosyltransferase involved in cell wall biosynthesis